MRTIDVWNGEQFPLFTSIGLETASKCNRKCIFCPVHDSPRADELMDYELIHKVLTELGSLKFNGRIAPYIYNEPLRDKRMVDIIKLIRYCTPRAVIMISTNGDYLTEELLDTLFAVGLNQLIINVYGQLDIDHAKSRAEKFQSWLDNRVWIDQEKSVYSGGSSRVRRAQVHHKYGVQQDGQNFGGGYQLQNRSGNVEWLRESAKKSYSGICTRPFRIMQINWKGDSILCCNDYYGEVPFGNVENQSLVELWNRRLLHEKREELQAGIRTGLCEHCDFKGGAYKHQIYKIQQKAPPD